MTFVGGIPIETQGSNLEHYSGLVCGYSGNHAFEVAILDRNDKIAAKVTLPPSFLRIPPTTSTVAFEPSVGQDIEVALNCPSTNVCSWWPARVKKIGGEFVVVDINPECMLDTDTANAGGFSVSTSGCLIGPVQRPLESSDIVERQQIRPISRREKLSVADFHFHGIEIPEGLEQYCQNPDNIQHLAKRCGEPVLICLSSTDDKSELLVISTDPRITQRAAIVDSTFVNMLRQKVSLLQQTEELSKRLTVSSNEQNNNEIYEEFSIPEEMFRVAIGPQGSNINKAAATPGILSVKLNRKTGLIKIIGKNKDAVAKARSLLDFSTDIFYVPRQYVGHIVGSGQKHLQHMVDRTALSGIKITNLPNCVDFVAFHLTGTKRSISDTELLLQFYIASLRELDQLRGVDLPPLSPVVNGGGDSLADDESTDISPDKAPHINGHADSAVSTTMKDNAQTGRKQATNGAPPPREKRAAKNHNAAAAV